MVNVKVESLMRKAESARVIELSETLMRWDHSHSVAHNLIHNSTLPVDLGKFARKSALTMNFFCH
jgi:hypothetical protein